MTTDWTAGVVGQGVADPTPAHFRWEWRAGACAEYGHPGSTFHPHLDRTWCQCGAVTYPGDRVDTRHWHAASPLKAWWDDAARAEAIAADVAAGFPIPDYDQLTIFDALEATP